MARFTICSTVAALTFLTGLTIGWGDTGNLPPPALQFTLALEKSTVEAGEPIVAVVRVVNHGTGDYIAQTSTRPAGSFDGFAFAVEDENGRPATPPRSRLPAAHWLGSWTTVKPHDQFERKLFLNYWFLPLNPGRYTVRGQYVPRTTAGNHTVEWPAVHAPPLEFTVIPVGETKLAVRVERLTAQLETGDLIAADFLGFTGDETAIAPLLNALHARDETLQRHAANALSNILDRPTIIAAALDSLREKGPNHIFVEWLHKWKLPASQLIPAYLLRVADPDVVTRLGALIGLQLERDAAHASAIRDAGLRALTDKDAAVRQEAVRLLAPDPEARSVLRQVAERDTNGRVRVLAKELLNVTPPPAQQAELRP